MNAESFRNLVHKRFNKCVDVLTVRSREYTGPAEDRDVLSNFKTAAALQSTYPIRALGGMLAKHTVALHDFCNDPTIISPEQWHEKITDTINYCLLLEALVDELQAKDEEKPYCTCLHNYDPGSVIRFDKDGNCNHCHKPLPVEGFVKPAPKKRMEAWREDFEKKIAAMQRGE